MYAVCQNTKTNVQQLLASTQHLSFMSHYPFQPSPPHTLICPFFLLAHGSSLRGGFGPRGRKFRCCPRSLWQSSGETRRPSSQPAGACEPLVSAFLTRPTKRWMSRRSSPGRASVVPYQVSLTTEQSPSPRLAEEWMRGKHGGRAEIKERYQ